MRLEILWFLMMVGSSLVNSLCGAVSCAGMTLDTERTEDLDIDYFVVDNLEKLYQNGHSPLNRPSGR